MEHTGWRDLSPLFPQRPWLMWAPSPSVMGSLSLPWNVRPCLEPLKILFLLKGLSTCAIYWRNRKLCYSVVFSAPENFAMHELKDTSTCKSWACTPPPWSFKCKFPTGTWRIISMPVLPLPSPATLVTSYNHNLEMFIAICNWAVNLAIGDTGTLKMSQVIEPWKIEPNKYTRGQSHRRHLSASLLPPKDWSQTFSTDKRKWVEWI